MHAISQRVRVRWSAGWRRDAYVLAVAVTSGLLFAHAVLNPTDEPWHPLAILALFAGMVVAERISVPLPQNAAVSIATIPHIMAVLLLPTWLTMALAASSMLVDQLVARAAVRKVLFNVASVALTTGVASIVADHVGLGRDRLAQADWQQAPAFLLVACTYYALTNSLVAIVLSLSGQKTVGRVLVDNAKFVLPAEFAVCGIGGLVTIVWLLNPAWAPLVLFPAIVSQVAYAYVSSSKHNQDRLAFIAEASRILGLSLDRRELAERTVQLCVPKLGDAAVLFVADDECTITLLAQAVLDGHGNSMLVQPDATSTLGAWALAQAHAAVLRQTADERSTHQISPGELDAAPIPVRWAVATLLRSAQRTEGVLLVMSSSSGADGGAPDVKMLHELAQRCAAGLANAQLHAEAQRATRLRDEFLAVAAHELKTPVTSLRGYAQLLQRNNGTPRPEMLAKGLHTIEVQSERLTELTAKLLDVSRIDSGKLQLEPRPTDLSLLVRETVLRVQHTTEDHDLRITICEPCHVWLDPLRIEQVITNLLANAIKYSPDGGTIEIALDRDGSDWARLSVRDHGLGVPPERRAHLFERLYQAHGDGYLSGLGLGLFISKQIVELHQGTIEAQFPPDGGTRVVIRLPIG
jgi:signal transduction histidine kinase